MQLGKWNPTENCFLTTYHPSFMVHWWVLVHSGHANHGHNCINAKNKNKKGIFNCNIPVFLKEFAKFREYIYIYMKTFLQIWALLLVW
jgi:hypothetical protein